ncbi:MAG: hypothetical protein KJ065_22930 [Anaerolineae bacterium]|nr:hypothetical protein [Anaerolineae bacterium]
MSGLVFFIEQIALGLYIFLVLGLLLTLRTLLRARGEYRATRYELERELARGQQVAAFTRLVLLIEAALFVLGVQQVMAPTLRAQLDQAALVQAIQPDDGSFITPVPEAGGDPFVPDTSNVVINPDLLVQRALATPTLTPTAVGTIIRNAPVAVGCESPDAQLQVPANGMIVFDPMIVRGVATTDNFAFYRLELMGGALSNFGVLTQSTSPVRELGELGQFTPSIYDRGEYRFRLTVFDVTAAVKASCEVTIYVTDPPATATPLGTQQP